MKKFLFASLVWGLVGSFLTLWAEVSFSFEQDEMSRLATLTYVYGASEKTTLAIPEKTNELYPVVAIADGVFEACPKLEKVTIPDAITNIGSRAFYRCARLKDLVLPKDLVMIGEGAFSDCAQLKDVVIPSNVKSIGAWAFASCRNLATLEIGSGVESIGVGAFAYSSGLRLSLTEDNAAYTMVDGVLYNKEMTDLIWCDRTRKDALRIPSTVTNIAAYAFQNCRDLAGVEIPASVVTIGDFAFSECAALAEVLLPEGLIELGSHTFQDCGAVTNVIVPRKVATVYNWTFAGMTNLTEVTIPDGVQQMGGSVFSGCEKLGQINFEGAPCVCETDTFEGIATDAIGIYALDYCESWEREIDSEGLWYGLPMQFDFENIEPVIANYEGLYDGAAHSITVKVPSRRVVISYALGEDGDWTTNAIYATNAGTNLVHYCLSLEGYDPIVGVTNLTILPRSVTLTSASATKEYDGTALVAERGTITGDGFVAGESVTIEYSGTQTDVGESKNTFTYFFNGKARAQNYVITKVEGTLTVTEKSAGPAPKPTPKPNPSGATNCYLAPTNEIALVNLSTAQAFNGYLYKGDDLTPRGTIQVKASKQKTNKKTGLTTSKISATIQIFREKKVTIKGEMNVASATLDATAKDGRRLVIELGAEGLRGTFEDYTIDGARDYFSSKDKAEKSAATDLVNALKAKGALALAWEGENGWNTVSLTIGTKGKTKVVLNLANGTKVSTSAQLIIGEEWCVIPVLINKKTTQLSFDVWIHQTTGQIALIGLDGVESYASGYVGGITGAAFFNGEFETLPDLLGDDTYEKYFPTNMRFTVSGTKWTLPKAGKVALKNGVVDESKLKDNPAALKLSYTAKNGTFKGSFKVYANQNGRVKSYSASVTGVVIDGIGYGTATIKKLGTISIWIIQQ